MAIQWNLRREDNFRAEFLSFFSEVFPISKVHVFTITGGDSFDLQQGICQDSLVVGYGLESHVCTLSMNPNLTLRR